MFSAESADVILPDLFKQTICLGKLSWKFGHLTHTEALILLCCLAKYCNGPIFEFGTFTGRTTYNLALNTPHKIFTIDIGKSVDAAANVEKLDYPDYIPGELFVSDPEVKDRIELIIGDSREIDLSRFYGQMRMVIVDGGHSYDAAKSDTVHALRMVGPDGVIIWDDYSDYWPGVKKAIQEIPEQDRLIFLKKEGLVIYISAMKNNETRDLTGRDI